ncbi:MAG: hypothetical protein AMXMBFR67_32970 [Nitrospira sp.]
MLSRNGANVTARKFSLVSVSAYGEALDDELKQTLAIYTESSGRGGQAAIDPGRGSRGAAEEV